MPVSMVTTYSRVVAMVLHVALHPFTNLHVAACAFQNAKSTGDNGLGTTNLIIIIIIAIILPVIIIGTYH